MVAPTTAGHIHIMIIELLMKLDVILKNVGCTVTKMLDHNSLPCYVGRPKESISAWWQGRAQNRCCCKPSNGWISLGTTTPVGHSRSRQRVFEACSAQRRVGSCPILFSRSAPAMETWNQWEHQRASKVVFSEGERHHKYPRGIHPTEIPRTESSP